MSTSEGARLHGLDHLRAAAIVLVLLFHYHVYYGVPAAFLVPGFKALVLFGWSGVDLFFVLSGYLIGDKLFRDAAQSGSVRVWTFYLNRAFRILPAYFVTLAIYFLFTELQEGRALQPLWRFLTFTQNIPIDLFANTFSHAWSLCVEEHFYLIFPVALYFLYAKKLQRQGIYVLLALIALGIVIRYVNWSEYVDAFAGRRRLGAALKYIYYPTYTRLDGLLVGIGIASMFRFSPGLKDRLIRYGHLHLCCGLAILAGCYFLFDGLILSARFSSLATTLIGFPAIAVGYGFIVVSALSPSSFLYRIEFRLTAFLATLAYAMYLTHKMANHWINTRIALQYELSDGQTFLLSLAVAVLAGFGLHFAIERPFLRLRDQWVDVKTK
ncbi:MAG: acyltransferase family protein [Alphaproteobacteria bacterium]|nr:acyltransferase family protein [Alphaproteobacteria bacterium]